MFSSLILVVLLLVCISFAVSVKITITVDVCLSERYITTTIEGQRNISNSIENYKTLRANSCMFLVLSKSLLLFWELPCQLLCRMLNNHNARLLKTALTRYLGTPKSMMSFLAEDPFKGAIQKSRAK